MSRWHGGIAGEAAGMRRLATAAVAAVWAGALLATSTASGSHLAKAFPSGCWIGKTPYGGTYASGPVKAKVTNGRQTIVLWVGADKPVAQAVGFITVTGVGAGTLEISGSNLSMKVKILGDYDLTGTASAVKVNGTYSMTGTAVGNGQFLPSVPVKLKYPVKNASLNVKTVTATHVSGLFGKAPWSVTRRPGAPSKNPAACANAA
jgi:hypothetical protein